MEHDPHSLYESGTLEQIGIELTKEEAALAGLQKAFEQKGQTLVWLVEFEASLSRGGASANAAPYDFEGVWRLIRTTDLPIKFKPVIARQDLSPGVDSKIEMVNLEDTATGVCDNCHQNGPLLGRSSPEPYGMGDVGFKVEVAVVHCSKVQPLSIPNTQTAFSPYPASYQ